MKKQTVIDQGGKRWVYTETIIDGKRTVRVPDPTPQDQPQKTGKK